MNKQFNDLMLDIETMGTKSFSAIVSIAAVPFNLQTGEVSDKFFYQIVDLQSCLDLNLRINAETLYWWMSEKITQEARNHISDKSHRKPLKEVLELFARFYAENMATSNASAWGNSAKFDLGIMENCYNVARLSPPWNTWKEKCVRTVSDLYGEEIKKTTKFEGVKHYPVDDCKHQIKYLVATHQRVIQGRQALLNEQRSASLAASPE